MTDKYDIHINAIAFTKAVSNYETEMKFKSLVGSILSYSSKDVYSEGPFEEDKNNLNLGLNLYPSGMSASIAASTSRPKGFTPNHLNKMWRIDPEIAKKTIRCITQLV